MIIKSLKQIISLITETDSLIHFKLDIKSIHIYFNIRVIKYQIREKANLLCVQNIFLIIIIATILSCFIIILLFFSCVANKVE